MPVKHIVFFFFIALLFFTKEESLHEHRLNSIVKLISSLNQFGCLPFALDEKDKLYKAIQATQMFRSPTKKPKFIEIQNQNEVSVNLPLTIYKMFLPAFENSAPTIGRLKALNIFMKI